MSLIQQEARKRKKRIEVSSSTWPEVYINSRTGREFQYRNEEYVQFVKDDEPKYMLLKGGEGGGKTAAGSIKTLNKLRRGMDGIMVNTDLPQFQKSTWPEFKEWVPWEKVVERHRHRKHPGWVPKTSFDLLFYNEVGGISKLICGGMSENEAEGWEGPNVHFGWGDEFRRHRTPKPFKILAGRTRLKGPNGEPSQLYLSSTPKQHWLYDYFGPIEDEDDDEWLTFKLNSFTATVLTTENQDNLDDNYVRDRGLALTEAEKRVYLLAEWGNIEDAEKFIQIELWHNCKEDLPPLGPKEPCIVSLDGSTGGMSDRIADTFFLNLITRHPERPEDVAVRLSKYWQPKRGQLLDFDPIKDYLRQLSERYSIIEFSYDRYQLHDMAMTLRKEGVGYFKEFSQDKERTLADKRLRDVIFRKGIAHNGDKVLSKHIDNADVKSYDNGRRLRLVKRVDSKKIDGAVSLSTGVARILHYNLG